ncbi:TPA: hypothetical protein ACIT51_000126 [Salmonella enterica subsp. enterica serovar Java]
MSNVYHLNSKSIDQPELRIHTDKSGGDDGGDGMNRRIQKLEEDVSQIKTDIAVIRSVCATEVTLQKEVGDVRKEMNNQTKWISASIFAALTIGLAVAKWLF